MEHPRSALEIPFDILYYLMLWFLPGEVALLRSVNHAWDDAASAVLEHRFNPLAVLGPFFRDVAAFQAIMAASNVIVTGSRVLHAYRPLPHPENGMPRGLDIVVEDRDAEPVYAILREEHFVRVADSSREQCELFPADSVYGQAGASFPYRSILALHRRFILRIERFARDDLYVDVATTIWTPVMAVLSFASTVDMVFMSWNRFYCLFPRSTALDGYGLIPAAQFDSSTSSVAKSESNGFIIHPWRPCSSGRFEGPLGWGHRWFGDARCWNVDIKDSVVYFDDLPARLWEANGCAIHYLRASAALRPREKHQWLIRLEFSALQHYTLDSHTYAAPSHVSHRFSEFMEERESNGYMGWASPQSGSQVIPYLLDWFEDDAPNHSDYHSESSDEENSELDRDV